MRWVFVLAAGLAPPQHAPHEFVVGADGHVKAPIGDAAVSRASANHAAPAARAGPRGGGHLVEVSATSELTSASRRTHLADASGAGAKTGDTPDADGSADGSAEPEDEEDADLWCFAKCVAEGGKPKNMKACKKHTTDYEACKGDEDNKCQPVNAAEKPLPEGKDPGSEEACKAGAEDGSGAGASDGGSAEGEEEEKPKDKKKKDPKICYDKKGNEEGHVIFFAECNGSNQAIEGLIYLGVCIFLQIGFVVVMWKMGWFKTYLEPGSALRCCLPECAVLYAVGCKLNDLVGACCCGCLYTMFCWGFDEDDPEFQKLRYEKEQAAQQGAYHDPYQDLVMQAGYGDPYGQQQSMEYADPYAQPGSYQQPGSYADPYAQQPGAKGGAKGYASGPAPCPNQCGFLAHSQQQHGYCCQACMHGNGHGPKCERQPAGYGA